MAGNEKPPDLAEILRALQGGGGQNLSAQPNFPIPVPQPIHSQHTYLSYPEPSTTYNISPQNQVGTAQNSQHITPPVQPNDSSAPHHIPREELKTPPVDPRTIITWPAALRHVTRLMARKPEVTERVQKLMKSQRDHENQWWDGRVRLLKQQSERGAGRKQIEEVLRSVGGHVDSSIQGPTQEDDAAELQRYDLKVHRALTEMESSFMAELTGLGVPFFGTKTEFIVKTGQKSNDGTEGDATKGAITKVELKTLQKRMIDLLADLCAD